MAALGFGLLSMALQYTTEYFSEPAVTLCCVAMVLGIIQWGQGRRYAPLIVGIAAGCALQFAAILHYRVGWPLSGADVRIFPKVAQYAGAGLGHRSNGDQLFPLGELQRMALLETPYVLWRGLTTPLWTGLHGYLFSSGKDSLSSILCRFSGCRPGHSLSTNPQSTARPPLHAPHRCQNAVLRQVVSLGWRMVLGARSSSQSCRCSPSRP